MDQSEQDASDDREIVGMLGDTIRRLPVKWAWVMRRHFEDGWTMTRIGLAMRPQRTRQRVKQIVDKSLGMMRGWLEG